MCLSCKEVNINQAFDLIGCIPRRVGGLIEEFLILPIRCFGVIRCLRALHYARQSEFFRANLPSIDDLMKLLPLQFNHLRWHVLIKKTSFDARVHLKVRKGSRLISHSMMKITALPRVERPTFNLALVLPVVN